MSDISDEPTFVAGICDGVWVKHYAGRHIRLRYDDSIFWVLEVPHSGDTDAFVKALDGDDCHHQRDFTRVIRTAILWKAVMYVEVDDAKQYGKRDNDYYKPKEMLFSHYWVPMEPDEWDVQKVSYTNVRQKSVHLPKQADVTNSEPTAYASARLP